MNALYESELKWALCWLGSMKREQSFIAFKIEAGDDLGEMLNYVAKVVGSSIPETYRAAEELIEEIKCG